MTTERGRDIFDGLADTIHRDTQEHADSCDLTVNSVYEVTGSGSLDFGGSEFVEADQHLIEPEKEDPEDDYGWWHLNEGTYLVEYNERPDNVPNGVAIVFPHERLLRTGSSHPAFLARSGIKLTTPLNVGETGCDIKENARISKMVVVTG